MNIRTHVLTDITQVKAVAKKPVKKAAEKAEKAEKSAEKTEKKAKKVRSSFQPLFSPILQEEPTLRHGSVLRRYRGSFLT